MESRISVTVLGVNQEVFMSYGLLTELARSIPSIDVLPAIVGDNDLRDAFLKTLLAKRETSGRVIESKLVTELNLSIEDAERLIEWGQEHLLDFFLRRLKKAQEQVSRIQTSLEASSLVGTPA